MIEHLELPIAQTAPGNSSGRWLYWHIAAYSFFVPGLPPQASGFVRKTRRLALLPCQFTRSGPPGTNCHMTQPGRSTAGTPRIRILDLAFIVILLPPLLVISAAIGIWIKLSSRGAILFRQERVGQLNNRFVITSTIIVSEQPLSLSVTVTEYSPGASTSTDVRWVADSDLRFYKGYSLGLL